MIIPAQTDLHPTLDAPSLEEFLADMPRWASIPQMTVGDVSKVQISFRSQAEQVASWMGERSEGDELDTTTDHAIVQQQALYTNIVEHLSLNFAL